MPDKIREATPSKAAMDLAEVCRNLPAPYNYATAIQSALRDLLEKAEALRTKYRALYPDDPQDIYNLPKSLTEFDAALEPWKPK